MIKIRQFIVVSATLLFLPGLALGQAPDRILHNGKIVTVDEDFSIAEAVAITGNRILAVGDNETITAMASEGTELLDLEGRTVLPGLIDSHIHYLRGTNYAAYELRIHGIRSRQKVLDMITERAEEIGPGEWIFIIGGWNEQQFEDKPGGFTGEELDAAAPNNPVYIQKTYSSFYMNTPAIEIIGPAVGDYYKGGSAIHVDNRTGRFVMAEGMKYFPFAVDLEGRMKEVEAFNDYLLSMGTTTAYDLGYLDGTYDPVKALHDAGELDVRVFYAARYWADSPRSAIAAAELLDREESFQRDLMFGMYGIGEHVHGNLHDSTAHDNGFPDEIWHDFEAIADSAAKNGWQLNEHVMQDSTANRMMDVSTKISEKFPTRDLRWTLGHDDRVKRPTIDRAKDLGWSITVHNHTVKPKMDGPASPPIRDIQDSGILWGMGSDGTIVATYNPFHVISEYVAGLIFPNIIKYEEHERITREEALIAHTRSNAWLMFMEDDLGTLEAGKLADLVVLDRDYMTVPANEIRDLKPVMTMVDGRIVYEAE
jgi:predicted amidohydrolase YtcJ